MKDSYWKQCKACGESTEIDREHFKIPYTEFSIKCKGCGAELSHKLKYGEKR